MARGKFIEEEVDFDGIYRKMAALEPPKLELEEVLGRLRAGMIEQRKRGVSVEQIVEVLKETGIEVGVRNLKHFIEKGELLGGRAKRPAGSGRAEEGGGRGEGAERGATAPGGTSGAGS